MFGNMGKMMKLAMEMKAKLPEMKRRLAESEYAADAGGGVVSATVNGKMQIVDVKIDPRVFGDDAMDAEMLADLIKAAVSGAQAKATVAAAEAMKELTGGMDLPGMDSLLE